MRLSHALIAASLALMVSAAAAAPRDLWFSGGGGGGGGISPPIPGPAGLPNAPTLGNSGPVVVLLTASAERPDRSLPRVAVIRLGTEVLGVAWLRPGMPAVLVVPGVEGLQLDVLGTDAVGVPVAAGTVVRVVAP